MYTGSFCDSKSVYDVPFNTADADADADADAQELFYG